MGVLLAVLFIGVLVIKAVFWGIMILHCVFGLGDGY